jgi:hypothetical protein
MTALSTKPIGRLLARFMICTKRVKYNSSHITPPVTTKAMPIQPKVCHAQAVKPTVPIGTKYL